MSQELITCQMIMLTILLNVYFISSGIYMEVKISPLMSQLEIAQVHDPAPLVN